MNATAMTTLAQSISLVSRAIRSVDSAARGSTAMMSYTLIVGTNTKDAMFVIGETQRAEDKAIINSIMSTMIR